MTMKFSLVAVGALLLAAVPILAHHSFSAEYDQSKPLTLKGKFTKLDWVNPHSWVHFDVVGAVGKGTTGPPKRLLPTVCIATAGARTCSKKAKRSRSAA